MNQLTLITMNLRRKPTRTSLTLMSLVIAFLLFMLLRAVAAAFAGGVVSQGVQRLYVDAKYSMTDNLPIAHIHAMRDLPGVADVTQMVWFGGYYQNPTQLFAKIPVDHTRFFTVFPDAIVSTEVLERFRASKRGVVVHESIVAQFGWAIGDVIPIRGDIWPKEDGSWDWEFVLMGTYSTAADSRLPAWFLLRHDYFNESVADWVKNQVGWAVVRLTEGADSQLVIDAIDGLFDNSSDPTKSLSEDAYGRQLANQLGDIGLITTMILGAVFFTIVLLTANVASMTFHERIPELAVMKTLGFGDGYVSLLVLVEAVTLCVLGAVLGVGLGFALEPALKANLSQVLGHFEMTWGDAAQAIAIAALLGLLIGMLPAWRAQRLPIVQALREDG